MDIQPAESGEFFPCILSVCGVRDWFSVPFITIENDWVFCFRCRRNSSIGSHHVMALWTLLLSRYVFVLKAPSWTNCASKQVVQVTQKRGTWAVNLVPNVSLHGKTVDPWNEISGYVEIRAWIVKWSYCTWHHTKWTLRNFYYENSSVLFRGNFQFVLSCKCSEDLELRLFWWWSWIEVGGLRVYTVNFDTAIPLFTFTFFSFGGGGGRGLITNNEGIF